MKVDRILGAAGPLREEYEKLLEDPNTLLKDLVAWFKSKGHSVNLTAINRHRHRHLETFRKVREAAKMATDFCEIVEKSDPSGAKAGRFFDAAQGRFEMLLMQDLFQMQDNPEMKPDDWQRWAKAMNDAAASRQKVEQIRKEYEQRAKQAADEVAKIGKGETGQAVVERVRQILGV